MSTSITLADSTCNSLRHPLDIKFIKDEGQDLIVLNCPLGISDQQLVLKDLCRPLLAELNGKISNLELGNKYQHLGLNRNLLNELLTLLDQSFFLDNQNFETKHQQSKQDFHQQTIRPAALAGLCYANEKIKLQNEINNYLTLSENTLVTESAKPKELKALIAPHIDYRRGQITYGKTYSQLKDQTQADLYILLGTAHQYSENTFHLCLKDFETPIGTALCDRNATMEIAKSYGYEKAFVSEILHKREHSLELQLPFLTYYYDAPKILPILVGSFAPYISKGLYPNEIQDYQDFVAALEQTIRNKYLLQNKTICFIAGVDMAHIGFAFGDRQGLSEARLKLIADQDAEYLSYIKNQDQQKLFEHIAKDHDARNICGYPSIYLLLDLLKRLNDQDLEVKEYEYRQAVDYQTDCAVTFAGLGIS